MRPIRLELLSIAMLTAACGGATTASSAETGGEEVARDEAPRTESPRHLPPELRAFHEVFEPVWHGDETTRDARACEAAEALFEHAEANHDAATSNPPAAVIEQAQWLNRASDLVAASRHLDEACDTGPPLPRGQVDAVHDAVHGLIELLPAPQP